MVHAVALTQPPLARPFLKWAGGKTQLLSNILPQLPEQIDTYYEPFIGGGAVFFALANEQRFRRAVIADQNPALVETYQVVKDEVDRLILALSRHANHALDSEYFYALRAQDTRRLSKVSRAARLLYLNKTCFNGLYRVNRKGGFNVPFGKYKKPRVLNEELLENASAALQGVEIVEADFESIAKRAKRGDAVYFDPPYVPISQTSSFAAYERHPFGAEDHGRLAHAYEACFRRGARAVLSNSDCPFTRDLYKRFRVKTVEASRAINSVANRRGKINEVLVVGVKPALRAVPKPRDSALPAATRRFHRQKKRVA